MGILIDEPIITKGQSKAEMNLDLVKFDKQQLAQLAIGSFYYCKNISDDNCFMKLLKL